MKLLIGLCLLAAVWLTAGLGGTASAALAPPGLNTISGPITSADWTTGKLVVNGYTVYVREGSVLRMIESGKERKLTKLDISVGDVVSVLAVPEGDHFVARILEMRTRR